MLLAFLSILHSSFFILAALVLLSPTPALAQPTLPPPPCTGLPGCGSLPANVIADAAIPIVATILLNTIAVLALIFILVGGARYILAFGRDEELQKAQKSIFWAVVGLFIALTSHQIVTIIVTETYLPSATSGGGPIFDFLQTVVRIMVLLLNVTLLLVIVLGGMRMVYARGQEEEVKKGRNMVAYAVIGAIIINTAPIVVKAVIHLF